MSGRGGGVTAEGDSEQESEEEEDLSIKQTVIVRKNSRDDAVWKQMGTLSNFNLNSYFERQFGKLPIMVSLKLLTLTKYHPVL